MSAEIWNLERDLCRCCHSEGVLFNDLAETCYLADQKGNYCDMIKDCVDIHIHPVPGVLAEVTYKICNACVRRLRDALDFKRQVQTCEEKFQRYYDCNAIKVKNESDNVSDIKEETSETLSVENCKVPDIKDEGLDTLSDTNEDFTNTDVIIEERDWNQESSDEDKSFTVEEEEMQVDNNLTENSVKKTTRRGKKKVKKKTEKPPLKKSTKEISQNNGPETEKESKKDSEARPHDDDDNFTVLRNSDGTSSLNCNICGKSFKNRLLFTQHNKQALRMASRIKPRKQGLWDEESLIRAMEAVQNKQMKPYAAASKFKIPYSTLRWHLGNAQTEKKYTVVRNSDGTASFICKTCGKSFKNRTDFGRHTLKGLKKPRKSGTRGLWDEEDLKRAMEAVQKNHLNANAAALKFNIPPATLRKHLLTGNTKKTIGKTTVLTKQVEENFVKRIDCFSKVGVTLTPEFIRRQAFIFCEILKIKHSFNRATRMAERYWLKMFLKRNPSVKVIKPKTKLSKAQKKGPIVDLHFEKVNKQ